MELDRQKHSLYKYYKQRLQILYTILKFYYILTRHDNGHLTGVNQKQIGTIHKHHVADHQRRIIAHTTVEVSKNKGNDEMCENPQHKV